MTPTVPVGSVRSPNLLHRPLAVACLSYLALLAGVAVVAPLLFPHVADEHAGDLLAALQLPSGNHWLGTDSLGRDVLERLLVGTRVTIVGVVEALVVVLALGVPFGLMAGYFGGWLDRIVSWLADMTFSMPGIVVVLVVLSVFPQSMAAGMITLGVFAAPGLMRVVRSATLPVREELYIAAAQVSGLSRSYIITRHVLPRISGVVIVQASLLAGVALLVQSGLGFLDLVVPAPAPSWGGMIADGAKAIVLQPWLIWPPGIMVAFTILALGVLGDVVLEATTESWSPSARLGRHSRPKARQSGERRASCERRSLPVEEALLAVEGLCVRFGPSAVLEDVSVKIERGEALGIVGESGCGKTTVAMTVMGLLPSAGQIEAGRIWFDGRDLAELSERELRRVRGRQIGLVSQDPMVSLTPGFQVGWQLAEAVRKHQGVSPQRARERAIELLREVRLPDPEAVARRYPHELSGGMAQRVAIARALAGEPKLLIADEATTALDVTVQAEILDLLREFQVQRDMAVLMITHDWGVVADLCTRAVVMYAGQIVEQAPLGPMFHEPLHPYTRALLAANPHRAITTAVLPSIRGDVPRPGQWPAGCHFQARCCYATEACADRWIPFEGPAPDRQARCIRLSELP
ncbi:peptide ABC transporter ATP-binding protein [Amycolatopsis sp. AA4]|nr:peptide ABC transporter ATP-binding protein [Amycolatopsis sp. AA4]